MRTDHNIHLSGFQVFQHLFPFPGGTKTIDIIDGDRKFRQALGNRFGISPLVVILSVIFWGWLWGPLGMFLAVPLTMVLKVLLDNSAEFQWISVAMAKKKVRHGEVEVAGYDLHLNEGETIGSGASTHNLRALGRPDPRFVAWDQWLNEALSGTAAHRNELLAGWVGAPGGRLAHPREEHLLPLMVVAGAAEAEPGRKIFTDCVLGVTVSAFQFG